MSLAYYFHIAAGRESLWLMRFTAIIFDSQLGGLGVFVSDVVSGNDHYPCFSALHQMSL